MAKQALCPSCTQPFAHFVVVESYDSPDGMRWVAEATCFDCVVSQHLYGHQLPKGQSVKSLARRALAHRRRRYWYKRQ